MVVEFTGVATTRRHCTYLRWRNRRRYRNPQMRGFVMNDTIENLIVEQFLESDRQWLRSHRKAHYDFQVKRAKFHKDKTAVDFWRKCSDAIGNPRIETPEWIK